MKDLYTFLAEHPVTYVTRDFERASAIAQGAGYSVVTDGKESDGSAHAKRSTAELLADKATLDNLKSRGARVLVFKNSSQIEEICRANEITLLNPRAALAEEIENKISQVQWLGALADFLPKHRVTTCAKLDYQGTPYVVQFGHGHTGTGTELINDESNLAALKTRFPDRPVRVTDYIKGPMFTTNIVVGNDWIMLGNTSLQITGIAPFTDNAFSTVGNDWKIPHSILSSAQQAAYQKMAMEIAKKMQADGWKGLFGIDVILEEATGKLYLIEINARQPASTTCESVLQKKSGLSGITTFEAHLAALLGLAPRGELIRISDGAQIVKRVGKSKKAADVAALQSLGFDIIVYDNKKAGSDEVRVRSDKGIMKTPSALNDIGEAISKLF